MTFKVRTSKGDWQNHRIRIWRFGYSDWVGGAGDTIRVFSYTPEGSYSRQIFIGPRYKTEPFFTKKQSMSYGMHYYFCVRHCSIGLFL